MTRVALIRLPTAEAYLLRNFVGVVAARGLAYEIAETPDQCSNAELVVVDADNQTAMSLWRAMQQERPKTVGILVAKNPVAGDGQLWIQRPLNSIKLLTALGQADVTRNPSSATKRQLGSNSPPVARTLNGVRVLVIDDSVTVRKQLEITLSAQGVQVLSADSGEAGLHMLSTNNIDLVFLDVMLPGADGYQICKTIKKNKQKQRVPIVMLTSKSSPFDRVKGSLAGCDSYLTKPVELRRLMDVLEKFRMNRTIPNPRDEITLVAGVTVR